VDILGIGIDLVEIARIRKMLERHGEHFVARVFTAGEREYCARMADPAPVYAARFAAKEAVSKALGTGIGEQLAWLEIDVRRESSGRPQVILSGAGAKTLAALGATGVLLTLSHAEHYAIAQAMLIRAVP
jgi:holo-[acyl-carrier protein] synthase